MDEKNNYETEIIDESTSPLEYELSDLNGPQSKEAILEYSKQPEYIKSRRKAVRLVLKYSVIFILLLNLIGGVLFSVPPLSNYEGLGMIVAVSISLLVIYLLASPKSGLNLGKVKRPFTFKDLIFFFGLMYFLNIVSGLLIQLIMEGTGIQSVDVTQDISNNLTWDLFLYAVLIGPILEELQFRGIYLKRLENYGAKLTIIVTALTFSFMHMNFIQSVGTIGIALILSYVGYFYSFKAAVILHIINNLLAAGLSSIDLESPIAIAASIFIYASISFALFKLFSKERRDRWKFHMGDKENNPMLKEFEDQALKSVLTDPVFIIYVILMVALAILVGYAGTML